jgi:2-C-methyl-D-erythritol 4-phosphate cytidylyltransferase
VIADLGGHPLVWWSVAAATAAGIFEEIVVLTAAERVDEVRRALSARSSTVRVAAGGASRTASSWAALAATGAPVIAIHDAARPFVAPSLFVRCVEAAERHGAAAAGQPLADTVRRADEAGTSMEELERDGLWQVQTPQAFRREVLERARDAAGDRTFTDDAAAVIAAGARVHMVPGERRNLKITTSEDLAYARELVAKGIVALSARGEMRALGGADG